jgi:hypothetical protein
MQTNSFRPRLMLVRSTARSRSKRSRTFTNHRALERHPYQSEASISFEFAVCARLHQTFYRAAVKPLVIRYDRLMVFNSARSQSRPGSLSLWACQAIEMDGKGSSRGTGLVLRSNNGA